MRLWIKNIVKQLQEKYNTGCPYSLATHLNIHVLQHDLHHEINGYYKYDRRNRYIVINNNLDKQMQRVVCAHELGHAVLHKRVNTPFMRNNTLLSVDKIEREANKFAAELLITDSDLFDFHEQKTIYDVATLHNVPIQLAELKYKGLFL
ncbi:ImmA/IrrE family metallo-endopeptidase [Lysinibacillus louembei]|uniref:ImmA/IrrE family metallo-endopeptidase n=1 Tax=Lysinibacillus louembei TaxID=1470088 RepID=A0ABZ0RYE0_9BACI|nr:ImmA/IrrE family metallo-endopeptidase [Lysinibacillus louembei]WPK12292.1 ImmA/IrrE family metallo-endopeptidase [Lysinibacillus louembei]